MSEEEYYGDLPVFKDGQYVYSTGQTIEESDFIMIAQAMDSFGTWDSSKNEKV